MIALLDGQHKTLQDAILVCILYIVQYCLDKNPQNAITSPSLPMYSHWTPRCMNMSQYVIKGSLGEKLPSYEVLKMQ